MDFVEPIRSAETVKDVGEYLRRRSDKWYVMYSVGIYSGLRISDILKLKVRDVRGKKDLKLREKKTGKERIFPIVPALAKILAAYCEGKADWEYLIPSTRKAAAPVSREYAYRVIHDAGEHFGLPNLGTHSLRKTFGYHFYMQTHDIVLLMRIFNHTDQRETLRYIGIEQTTINQAMQRFKY